jgi:vitamin B12 transporter
MNPIKTFTFLLLLFAFGYMANAQTVNIDSTYTLKEVNVTSNRLVNFSAGSKIERIDSLALVQHKNQNLADLLSDESPIYIKSYGQGALATTSFRGGSASQTALLWNGFNLNLPSLGQFDLSLIPVGLMDGIAIQYGGNTALWGSGAVGGTIHLLNSAKFDNGISAKVNFSAGSFGTYNQQCAITFSKKRFVSTLKVFNTAAENNFTYKNVFTNDNKTITQTHAQLKSQGFLSENYFLINNNQKINLFFWYQNTDRNLPPTMLQQSNLSNQVDKSYRLTSEYKYEKGKTTNYIRTAYFDERLNYSDINYGYDFKSKSQSIIAEAESRIKLNEQNFVNIGINNTNAAATDSGFSGHVYQNKTAAFASFLFRTEDDRLKANTSIRKEYIKDFTPFTYTVGADYEVLKNVVLKANVAKVYRLPTFNDLYWKPRGNPNLLPENGYAEEIGFKSDLKTANTGIGLITEATYFNKNIDNWIIWLPGASFWSPHNIMKVWSRGVETNNTLWFKLNKAKISLNVLTNYTVSTNQQAKFENDESVDKQLIYVPLYSGHAKLTIQYSVFTFSYRQNYTGYRFTSTDNTQYLPPYTLGSVYFAYNNK